MKVPLRARAVFLDRDGVLVEEKGYVSSPDEVILLPKAAGAVRKLSRLGLKVIIVTNQSGIGRGLFTTADYHRVMDRMYALLKEEGASVDGAYFCPHAPWDGCGCRKPMPGLAEQAGRDFGLVLEASFVVGDKGTDLELARAIGAKGVLVRTGYGKKTEESKKVNWEAAVDDVSEAAKVIEFWVLEEKHEGPER
ncbi:MAG: D-glycero-alpha-D-manno-heptose-1,7-bisphosphate 7-phosphatase [Thermovirgaceae bacterium]